MNLRLEMKAVSTSSDLKDRGQAMKGHLPAHPNTNIYVQRRLWENWCKHCPAVTTTLFYSVSQGNMAGSVCCNQLKVTWNQPSDQNAVDCAENLSCCSMTASGHILFTSVLLQWTCTAFQCVTA
jgi:hypothetical protein